MRIEHLCVHVCVCACAFCETAYTASERCACGSSQRDIPLVMFPQTFLSPFVPPPSPLPLARPPFPCASRPPLSRVRRSHECACIRIPAVRPLNLRPLSTSLVSWKPRRSASELGVFAGDQNISLPLPPTRTGPTGCVQLRGGSGRGGARGDGVEFNNRPRLAIGIMRVEQRGKQMASFEDYDVDFEVNRPYQR